MVMIYLTKERMQYSVKVFVRRGYTIDAWDSVRNYMNNLGKTNDPFLCVYCALHKTIPRN